MTGSRFLMLTLSGVCAAALWTAGAQAADAPVAAATPDKAVQDVRAPLLVIRFNKNHVYFDKQLRQGVSAAERSRADIFYEIISYIPTKDKAVPSNLGARADENLTAVVKSMNDLGVPPSRIRASTQPSTTAESQEVHVFAY